MKQKRIISLVLCFVLFLGVFASGSPAYMENAGESGLKLNKYLTKEGNQLFVNLEAYATGSVTPGGQVPMDIVFVLDQSGSMTNSMNSSVYEPHSNQRNNNLYQYRHNGGEENLYKKINERSYAAVSVRREAINMVSNYMQKLTTSSGRNLTNKQYWDTDSNLYFKDGETYKEVKIERKWIEGWFSGYYSYTYTFSTEPERKITSNRDSGTPNFGELGPLYRYTGEYRYFYSYKDRKGTTYVLQPSEGPYSMAPETMYRRRTENITRFEAMKRALKAFVDIVYEKANENPKTNHRISLVGFATPKDTVIDTYYPLTYLVEKNTELFYDRTSKALSKLRSEDYAKAFYSMDISSDYEDASYVINNKLGHGGATYTNKGMEMAKGVFDNNPILDGEERNRVVVVLTDGVPGATGYDTNVANAAVSVANELKDSPYQATVYSIGIFEGADASGNATDKVNKFMHSLSSNNGVIPEAGQPGYYLTAADSGALTEIFENIADQINVSTKLGEEAQVRDKISKYFKLPDGADKNSVITMTYDYLGQDSNGKDLWANEGVPLNPREVSIEGDEVQVSGFDYSENWCGFENEVARGKKLVIKFPVEAKPEFLGGNNVPTNETAGVYENPQATEPIDHFPEPHTNVALQDVSFPSNDLNVYLYKDLTAEEIKSFIAPKIGNMPVDLNAGADNFGFEPWQLDYAKISFELVDAEGNKIGELADITDLSKLKEDKTYSVKLVLSPKEEAQAGSVGDPDMQPKSATGNRTIKVFKPELTFKDSDVWYGDTAPASYEGNKVAEVWKHGDTEASTVTMYGEKPALDLTYTPEDGKIVDNTIATKEDIGMDVTVKIGSDNINDETKFKHQPCDPECQFDPEKGFEFLLHPKTVTLRIKKLIKENKGTPDETFVVKVKRDKQDYTEVVLVKDETVTISELPIGTYSIDENAEWSWRYHPTYENNGVTLNKDKVEDTITITNERTDETTLNGYARAINIYGVEKVEGK